MNFFQTLYLTHFSKPKENRPIYQAIKLHRPKIIVELGIQRGIRMTNMLQLACSLLEPSAIQYFCVDPFEGRIVEDGPGLSLRKTHMILSKTGVRTKTVPADAEPGFRQLIKGGLKEVELLVIATPSLAWIQKSSGFFTNILTENALVFAGQSTPDGKPFEFQRYTAKEFLQRSAATQPPAKKTTSLKKAS